MWERLFCVWTSPFSVCAPCDMNKEAAPSLYFSHKLLWQAVLQAQCNATEYDKEADEGGSAIRNIVIQSRSLHEVSVYANAEHEVARSKKQ